MPEKSTLPNSTLDGALDFPVRTNGASETQVPLPQAPDPFDVESLRLPPNSAAAFGVKKLLLRIPIEPPDKASFIRVHPSSAYRIETAMLQDERDRFFIARELLPELATETAIRRCVAFTAITRQGAVFLWPITLPGPDGRQNSWHESAFQAAAVAEKHWVRVTSNQTIKGYDVSQAMGNFPEPEWPDLPFGELLRIASRNRIIDSLDHPTLRRLRGEI